jgi:WhiB family transcriptional regulator, redox-sensing transcriptional regulator
MNRAACRGSGIDFFPDPAQGEALRRAKHVCLDCPVSWQCLKFALENGERGVWGGTSEAERDRMQGRKRSS